MTTCPSPCYRPALLCAALLLATFSTPLMGADLEVGDKDYTTLAGFDRSMYFYLPGVTPPDTVFEVVDGPEHGTVRDDPERWQYKFYRSDPEFSGTDSFTYRAINSEGTSNIATVTITVSGNQPPEVTASYISHFRDLAPDLQKHYLHFSDPDRTEFYSLQEYSGEVVDEPDHGSVEIVEKYGGLFFVYQPEEGFAGRDRFTYKVTDGGLWSDTAPVDILVRDRGDLSDLDVNVIVDGDLVTPLADAIDQLRQDMEAEGYGVSVIDGSGMSAQDIWQRLRTDRLDDTRWLSGAILIGDLPKPGDYDKNYWHLTNYRTDDERRLNADIWVSRIPGNDPDLIRNALDANHHYRTGATRLPRRFWDSCDHDEWGEEVDEALVTRVWPSLERNSNDSGDVIEPFTKGADTVYRTDHNQPSTPNGPYQTFFAFIDGCYAINKKNGPQTYQWSRGGSNVFSVGANDLTGPGAYNLSERLETDESYADILAGGEPVGSFLLAAYHSNWQMNWAMTHIFGDPSLPVLRNPGNDCPTIDAFIISDTTVTIGTTITATVTIADTDATSDDSPHFDGECQVEWFTHGYQRDSRMAADATHILDSVGDDSLTITYTAPHRYTLRVEVMDEWRARAWQEKTITVGNDPSRPLRINCGAESSFGDWADGQGQVWLYDQSKSDGTWGWSGKSAGDQHDGDPVSDTAIEPVFQRWRELRDNKSTVYRIPLPNGTYTVDLGFADLRSTATGQRLLDASIEDQAVLDDFDAYAEAGAATACWRSHTIEVTDGELTIDLRTDSASPSKAGIAAIRILPPPGIRTIFLEDITDSMPACRSQPSVTPSLENGYWCFEGLDDATPHRFGWSLLSSDG